MLLRLISFLILSLYFLVLIVALSEGPMVSIQSFILGNIGLVIFFIFTSHIAKKINLVDIGNEERKSHKGKIPLVGGIGLFISFLYGAFVFGVDSFYLFLIGSLMPIMFVGIIDSFHGISVAPVYRIIAQIISSWLIIATTDIYVDNLGNLLGYSEINIGTLGIPFTIFSVVGICNAFNMLDGKDGILGSVSLSYSWSTTSSNTSNPCDFSI